MGSPSTAILPKKMLFIGKRFYTNKDALAERFGRIFHLPSEWSKSEREVDLWLVDYHSNQSENAEVGALSIRSTPVVSVSFARRFLSALTNLRKGVVIASGDCYIGLLGWAVARLTGSTFVLDVYDKYDEFGGYVRPLGWDLFGFLLRHADICLFASRALAVRMSKYTAGRVVVVPNGVDASLFRPMELQKCRDALSLDGSLSLVGYFGGMESDRGVSDLVSAVETLRSGGRDVRLLVCGKSHPDTSLDQDWILYRGMVSHQQMPLYINASDVVVVPYRRSEFMDMGASCKIAEYLMCAKRIVSTSTPNFLSNFPIQVAEMGPATCQPEDPADMARAIAYALTVETVATMPADLTWPKIAAQVLTAIDEHYSRANSHG